MLEKFFKNKSKEETFTELYNQNFEYVYSFVSIRTVCDAQITEEIVQETFTAAWLAQDQFRNGSTYRTWLCAIAKNKLYEHYRKKITADKHLIFDTDNIIEQSSDFELEQLVISSETRVQVQEALNIINPVYRYSLILKYIDGYSIKQIAKHLGRTTKAIDGVLQKAKTSFIKEYLRIERGSLYERKKA